MRNEETELSSPVYILFWLLGLHQFSLTAELESRWSSYYRRQRHQKNVEMDVTRRVEDIASSPARGSL